MGPDGGRRPLVPTWGVVVSASLERDPDTGVEAVCVTVTSTPAPTPPGLGLRDALHRLEPALAPGEALALHIEGIEHLVGDAQEWPVLLGLPERVRLVYALGRTFDRADPEADALWRLALRLLAEPAGRGGHDGMPPRG